MQTLRTSLASSGSEYSVRLEARPTLLTVCMLMIFSHLLRNSLRVCFPTSITTITIIKMERTPLLRSTSSQDQDSPERSPAPSYRTIESRLPAYAEYNIQPPTQYIRSIEIDDSQRDPALRLSPRELRRICRDVLGRRRNLIRQLSTYPKARLRIENTESGKAYDTETGEPYDYHWDYDIDEDTVIGGWKYICVGFLGVALLMLIAFGFAIWCGGLHE